MKRLAGLVAILVLVLGVCSVVYAAEENTEFSVPETAAKALAFGQGEFMVSVPRVDGRTDIIEGSAFLVSDDGLVVTDLSLLSLPVAVLEASEIFRFRNVFGKFEFSVPEQGLAFFRLDEVPYGMKPVAFADDVKRGEAIFSKVAAAGLFHFEQGVYARFDNGVIFQGRVADKTPTFVPTEKGFAPTPLTLLYLTAPIPKYLRGGLFVNADGEAVGMGYRSEDGLGVLVDISVIRGALAKRQAQIDEAVKQETAKGTVRLSSEEQRALKQGHNVLNEIMAYYLNNSLDRPENLRACIQELFAMWLSGQCRDRFTHYETPEEVKMEDEMRQQGSYAGVGMQITMRDGFVVVVAPTDGAPAARAGILAGDVITHVGTKEVRTANEAALLLRGPEGTEVVVKILREKVDHSIVITLKRERIITHAVTVQRVPEAKAAEIGVLKLADFGNKNISAEFDAAFGEFKKQGMTKVILDLRNNPGGMIGVSMQILSYFMGPDDIAMTFRERNGSEKYDRAYLKEQFEVQDVDFGKYRNFCGHMVILTNGGSASASEIVAGAMKDWGCALILGENPTTFGKGVGQTGLDLSDGSRLFLTTFEFLVGNHAVPIRDKGVQSDVVVKPSPGSREDLPMKEGIGILKKR